MIHHNDNIAIDVEMTAAARLALHQTQSKPIMDDVLACLGRRLDDKLVGQNSALGGAFKYLQIAGSPGIISRTSKQNQLLNL